MNALLMQLIPEAIYLLPICLLCTIPLWRRYRRRHRKNPLTFQMLRAPGESISQRIDEHDTDIMAYFVVFSNIPVLSYTLYLSNRYLAHHHVSPLLYLAFAVVSCSVIGVLLNKRLEQRHNEYLGLDCERAVGQELNHLMLDGYRVYHDFVADKFNIDHVVIGKNGVFAIETKGRAKAAQGKGREAVKVVYDGHTLRFPTWNEREPIEQARRQASWLSHWLTQAVGENVAVKPVLALTGWFVECTKNDLTIYNGKNPSFIANLKTESLLTPTMIQRIAHQLEQRCRNVSPLAYRND